jgi:hypothetical protein
MFHGNYDEAELNYNTWVTQPMAHRMPTYSSELGSLKANFFNVPSCPTMRSEFPIHQ